MIKIFTDKSLRINDTFEVNQHNHHHLQVVKAIKGDKILVGDKKFDEYIASTIDILKDKYILKVESRSYKEKRPLRDVTLYISFPKNTKFEEIISKCTQIGVSRFVPFISSRTVKKVNERNMDKLRKRWMKKAIYGSEVSKRKIIPVIGNIIGFDDTLKDFSEKEFGSGILFWENSGCEYISKTDISGKMAVFIGPEGGFSETEVKHAHEKGILIRGLGNLVMEVMPACLAAASLILCQDLQ